MPARASHPIAVIMKDPSSITASSPTWSRYHPRVGHPVDRHVEDVASACRDVRPSRDELCTSLLNRVRCRALLGPSGVTPVDDGKALCPPTAHASRSPLSPLYAVTPLGVWEATPVATVAVVHDVRLVHEVPGNTGSLVDVIA